ncbi:Polyketide cyclase/dehydrase [Actinobacteria bacterium OK074]|nr:Polyketide cyclase/dehydrase [Actinobacteria bacterium OK074]
MVLFHLERTTSLSVEGAWRRLTDWPRHARVVPLTRVRVRTAPPTREGTRFVARTGLGPLSFDDPMEVVEWHPPAPTRPTAHCRLLKHGRLVTGWARIEVSPYGDGGARVVWQEELAVRHLPTALDPLLRRAARLMFGRAVDGLLST